MLESVIEERALFVVGPSSFVFFVFGCFFFSFHERVSGNELGRGQF